MVAINASRSQLRQTAYQCTLNGGRSPWYYVTWYNGWDKFNLGTSQGRDGLFFERKGEVVIERSGKTYNFIIREDDDFILRSLDGSEYYDCRA